MRWRLHGRKAAEQLSSRSCRGKSAHGFKEIALFKMKIAVALKQVPARDAILRLNGEKTWIDEKDVSFEVNEPDTYALEEALALKEKYGGEVLVCSLGPARVRQAIKEALAKGADRAVHFEDAAFHALDAHTTALVLSKVLATEKPDLVLTGLQSDDAGYAQTGVILAELLGFPHATIVMETQVDGQKLRVKRELEAGWFQWVEMELPAVLTIQSGINKPRYASLKGIMQAKSKPIEKKSAADLGLSAAELKPRQKILRLYVPEKKGQTEFLEGTPKEAAAKLVDKLRNEARVL